MLVRGMFERYDAGTRRGSTMRRRDGQFLYRLSADIANRSPIGDFTDVGAENAKKTYSLYY